LYEISVYGRWCEKNVALDIENVDGEDNRLMVTKELNDDGVDRRVGNGGGTTTSGFNG
jgi:hypothetical protein